MELEVKALCPRCRHEVLFKISLFVEPKLEYIGGGFVYLGGHDFEEVAEFIKNFIDGVKKQVKEVLEALAERFDIPEKDGMIILESLKKEGLIYEPSNGLLAVV